MKFVEPPVAKIMYVLNHPGKGKFFKELGFNVGNWRRLQAALLNMAAQNQASMRFRRSTIHGKEYEIIGDIETPVGRKVSVKSGWWMDPGQNDRLRFVTAYPND